MKRWMPVESAALTFPEYLNWEPVNRTLKEIWNSRSADSSVNEWKYTVDSLE